MNSNIVGNVTYNLECEHAIEGDKTYERHYQGVTDNFKKRYGQHETGKGAAFTKKYKPLGSEKAVVIPCNDEFSLITYELSYTLINMMIYGIKFVRGGPWCRIELTGPEIESIIILLDTMYCRCNKCHIPGHSSWDCKMTEEELKKKYCTKCRVKGHGAKFCSMYPCEYESGKRHPSNDAIKLASTKVPKINVQEYNRIKINEELNQTNKIFPDFQNFVDQVRITNEELLKKVNVIHNNVIDVQHTNSRIEHNTIQIIDMIGKQSMPNHNHTHNASDRRTSISRASDNHNASDRSSSRSRASDNHNASDRSSSRSRAYDNSNRTRYHNNSQSDINSVAIAVANAVAGAVKSSNNDSELNKPHLLLQSQLIEQSKQDSLIKDQKIIELENRLFEVSQQSDQEKLLKDKQILDLENIIDKLRQDYKLLENDNQDYKERVHTHLDKVNLKNEQVINTYKSDISVLKDEKYSLNLQITELNIRLDDSIKSESKYKDECKKLRARIEELEIREYNCNVQDYNHNIKQYNPAPIPVPVPAPAPTPLFSSSVKPAPSRTFYTNPPAQVSSSSLKLDSGINRYTIAPEHVPVPSRPSTSKKCIRCRHTHCIC